MLLWDLCCDYSLFKHDHIFRLHVTDNKAPFECDCEGCIWTVWGSMGLGLFISIKGGIFSLFQTDDLQLSLGLCLIMCAQNEDEA